MAFFNPIQTLLPLVLPGGEMQLRAPAPRDYQAWKQIRQQSREFLQPYEPGWPVDDLTRPGYRRRLRRYEAERGMKTGETYFLVFTNDNLPIGGISISNIRQGAARSCSIGYWMGENHAGKGYMGQAVLRIARHVFDDLALHRIEAACLLDNSRSSQLLQRAGFKQEGVAREYFEINGARRDHMLYSLLHRDM